MPILVTYKSDGMSIHVVHNSPLLHWALLIGADNQFDLSQVHDS